MTIKYAGSYRMWAKPKAVQYHKFVDLKLLESFGVDIVFYEPWQIGMFMEGLGGKFLWYPTAGTLVYDNSEIGGGFTRLGEKGDYPASAMQHKGSPKPKDYVTELVYERMMQQFEIENTSAGVTVTSSE
jgi:hypothetical protein